MIVVKYSKTSTARFVSHIDLLRQWARILRRAQIQVNYSQGFNPHALVFFSPPISLGISSVAEYITIDTAMKADDVLTRLQGATPLGLDVIDAVEVVKNPNLAGKVVAADYILPTAFEGVQLDGAYTMKYVKQGEEKSETLGDKLRRVYSFNGKLGLRLSLGTSNLRVDRLAKQIEKDFNRDINVTDIVKTAQYVVVDNEYVNVDDFVGFAK